MYTFAGAIGLTVARVRRLVLFAGFLSVVQGCTCLVTVEEPEVDAGSDGGGGGGAAGGGVGACVPPPEGIVGWWDADLVQGSVVSDRIGAHSGSLSGGATVGTGVVSSAFHFDGRDAVLTIPFATDLVPASAMTFELWVRPASAEIPYARFAAIAPDFDYAASWALGMSAVGGSYFGIFHAGTQGYIEGKVALPVGSWTHIADTWDGLQMHAYINGVLQSETATIPGPMTVSATSLLIGHGSGPMLGFGGDLDELTLYSKALTETEIRAIYDAGAAGKCK